MFTTCENQYRLYLAAQKRNELLVANSQSSLGLLSVFIETAVFDTSKKKFVWFVPSPRHSVTDWMTGCVGSVCLHKNAFAWWQQQHTQLLNDWTYIKILILLRSRTGGVTILPCTRMYAHNRTFRPFFSALAWFSSITTCTGLGMHSSVQFLKQFLMYLFSQLVTIETCVYFHFSSNYSLNTWNGIVSCMWQSFELNNSVPM